MESQFRCKPDNLVDNNMLHMLCKKERSEELIDFALMILRRIKFPDTYSYSNILVGLCKFGRFETALDVFGEIGRAGLVPTRSAVNFLIGELCSLSAKGGAVEKVVKDAHKPFTILVPNLISELCRLGKMEEAVKLLKLVEGRKLSCVEEGYSIVIHALCEHRLVEEASHLFGKMLSQGMKPKNWEDAYGLLIEMLGLGLSPHFHTCSLVDKLLRDNAKLDLLFKLEWKLDSQILHKFCKAGELGAAYERLKSMLENGFYPPVYVKDAFEHAYKKSGKLKMARELLEKIENDSKPDETEFRSSK
uniref:Pentatricopeptide repeat-containing protein n=1 Tax=Quercus lobata TaxID=97700 RepID=A0A7N2MUS7_QUELO